MSISKRSKKTNKRPLNRQWHVINIGYNNSHPFINKIAQRCVPRGCALYIPSIFKYSDYFKTRIKKQSLFEFYIFILCDFKQQGAQIIKSLKVNSVDAHFLLDVSGNVAVLTEDEINNVREYELNFKHAARAGEFQVGDYVEAFSSPMCGFKGNVSQITEKYVYCSAFVNGKVIHVPFLPGDIAKVEEEE